MRNKNTPDRANQGHSKYGNLLESNNTQQNQESPVVKAALAYVQKGKEIFPVNPANKRPYFSKWPVRASSDESKIREWFETLYPEAMIALPTGETNSIVVIDCDEGVKDGRRRNGVLHFHELCKKQDYCPEITLWQSTPSGGRHYFFKYPEGYDVRNSTSKLVQDVDIRGNGGYIVLAPSQNSEGKPYCWQGQNKIQEIPTWLLQKILDLKKPYQLPPPDKNDCYGLTGKQKYGEAALAGEINKIVSAQAGARNDTLNQSSYCIGQLVQSCGLDQDKVANKLIEAGIKTGLPFSEAKKTVESGLSSGMHNPRDIDSKSESYLPTQGESETSTFLKPVDVPLQAFPKEIQRLLPELADSVGAPLQIAACFFLGFLSTLVGRARGISLKQGWTEHGNLWLCSVARSSEGKSPVMEHLFKPIHDLEFEAKKEFDRQFENFESEFSAWQKKKDEGDIRKPEPPVQKQALADDSTIEKIGAVLAENPKGVCLLRDELSGLFYDLDRKDKGRGAKARFLSAYSCQSWKTGRINKERNIYVPKACLSICGGIQPGVLTQVFQAGVGGFDEQSGLLPRFNFILAQNDKPSLWTDITFSQESQGSLKKIATYLWKWKVEKDDSGNEIEHIFNVSDEAKASYIRWYDKLAEDFFSSKYEPVIKKVQAGAQRICLLLHSLDCSLDTDERKLISQDCMDRALKLADWILENQLACWKLFDIKNPAKIASPLEKAIMQAIAKNEASIRANGMKVSYPDLSSWIQELTRISFTPEKIGRACSEMGLKEYRTGQGRGRLIDEAFIDKSKSYCHTVIPSYCHTVTNSEHDGMTDVTDDSKKKNEDEKADTLPEWIGESITI